MTYCGMCTFPHNAEFGCKWQLTPTFSNGLYSFQLLPDRCAAWVQNTLPRQYRIRSVWWTPQDTMGSLHRCIRYVSCYKISHARERVAKCKKWSPAHCRDWPCSINWESTLSSVKWSESGAWKRLWCCAARYSLPLGSSNKFLGSAEMQATIRAIYNEHNTEDIYRYYSESLFCFVVLLEL